jgi:hypothetical protein
LQRRDLQLRRHDSELHPDQVVQNGDTVYLLSSANRRVYRWSIATVAYLNPYVVPESIRDSHRGAVEDGVLERPQRLYLGYGTGAIRYIERDAAAPVETAFPTRRWP